MNARRKWLQRLLPAAVSVGALAWLFGAIEMEALLAALSWHMAAVLVPALLVYGAVSLALEAYSIVWLITRTEDFGAWTAARIKCASYLLGIVNYALGAAALTVLLRRRAGLGLGESASVVLLISSLDIVVVVAFAVTGGALVEAGTAGLRLGLLAALGVGFFAGMALLRAPGSMGPLDRLRSLSVFEALRTTPLPRLLQVGSLRVLFSISFIALSWASFYAFQIPISLSQLVLGMMLVAVVSALPIAVAGLGTSQAAVLYVFRDLADPGALLALSLVLSAGMISLRAAMGVAVAREFTREVLEQSEVEAA